MNENNKPTGLASLAALGSGDDFSVIDAIGGVRGVVESMLPGFVFVVMFVVSRDLKITIVVSAVLAVLEVLVRLLQRQTILGALSGLIAVAICLVWAWNTHEARNYYVYGFITNSVYLVVLALTLAVRVPGVGFLVEFIRSMPTSHFRDWLADWRDDRKLYKAYVFVTALWMCLFALRLVVQVPLYLTNHVTWLGTTRLLMGLPFWALAIWVSYLLIADPIRHHPKFMVAGEDDDSDDSSESNDSDKSGSFASSDNSEMPEKSGNLETQTAQEDAEADASDDGER